MEFCLTLRLLYPIGGDAIGDHLADGSKERLLTSLVVLKKAGVESKFPDLGFGQK